MDDIINGDNLIRGDEVIRLLQSRHSIREFQEKPVPQYVRDTVIQSGMRAPTAGNMMLYSILEIENQTLKETLARTCDNQPFIAASPWILVFLADYARWMGYFQYSGIPEAGISGPGLGDMLLASCDAMAAAQNIVIAAEAFGLGSCYIGDIMENYEAHRELLSLPDHVFPITMLCLGYPTERQARLSTRSRFDRKHIVFTDRYLCRKPSDYEDMFADRNLSADGLFPGAANFGQHMYLRKFSSDFMNEMRRSVLAGLRCWDNTGIRQAD